MYRYFFKRILNGLTQFSKLFFFKNCLSQTAGKSILVIVLQATSNETHKAQSKTNHTLLTPVFEAQTFLRPSASAHVLLSPSSLSVMVSVVCPSYCQSALTAFLCVPLPIAEISATDWNMLSRELQIWMKRIGGIEKTTRLPSDSSNNVMHIPEEKFHLGSILLLVLSAAAAFTVPDYLGY